MSPETIERVRTFLDEVGYIPNINARNLAQGSSKIIGVVLKTQEFKYENVLSDPFVSELVSGIEATVRRAGYFMMLYISNDIAEILRYVATWNVDGLILFCMQDDDSVRVMEKYQKPLVFVDTYSGLNLPNLVNVGMDDEGGAFEAVKYLTDCGHRNIGFLTVDRLGVDYVRFRGYRRALAEAGIEYSDRSFFLHRPKAEEREKSIGSIAEKVISGGYTAVFCCSDIYAMTLISALRDHGARVPDDVSVIGFDDNIYAQLYRPALTTMHQETYQKGELAAETLLDLLRGKAPENPRIVMKPTLVIRDTVKDLTQI